MEHHESVDLVLLDMGLPDQDGIALSRQIRERSEVPIIAVTARREKSSVVAALRAGVDDYVTKPYSLAELMARIDAVMRRFGHRPAETVSELGDLRLDHGSRQVFVDGDPVVLARKEFELLSMLVQGRGDAVTREALMQAIWDTLVGGRLPDPRCARLVAALEAGPARDHRDRARGRLPHRP